ncbi:hypothetical protein KEM55_001775 [Ascosphaera atra]|nr:hypothetical protein KEM55_001775 [Ascosphaera atra]
MAVKKKGSRQKKLGSLSRGRPPTINKPAPSLSAKATRRLIRSHHQLHKARAQAVSHGDEHRVREIDAQIQALGGLESYQLASKKGQSKERGGDSSKVLLDWLTPTLSKLEKADSSPKGLKQRLRLLEIGALSTQNACSMAPTLDVTRIDLHSQEQGILQQDFMARPLPSCEGERFHVISLSLVLNYVPDPATRGEMLRRTTRFLGAKVPRALSGEGLAPVLFLVLPAACVLNSRYLTEERLEDIMVTLGYRRRQRKVTNKLVYYLWEFDEGAVPGDAGRRVFRKEEVVSGKARNNFAVTLNAG